MSFWDYLVNSAASTSSGYGYSAGVAASAYNHELNNSEIMLADSDRGSLVKDSEQSQIEKLVNELGLKLNDASKDYLVQYMLNEKLSQNAYAREIESRKTAYQDTVKDLQAAGLNPFLALQGLSGAVSNSAGGVSGGNYVNRTAAKESLIGSTSTKVLMALTILAGVIIKALV